MCSEDLKTNRYLREDILEAFENIESIDKVITLEIPSIDTLEIYLDEKHTIDRDFIKEVLSQIPLFDDTIQEFCKINSERSSFGYRNYVVDLSWISIEPNKVIMRYWGRYVNIELEAIFEKSNITWENADIYYR